MKTIPLQDRSESATVDSTLYPALMAMGRWIETNGYAALSIPGERRLVYMHDVVLSMHGVRFNGTPDHINDNPLDNRFDNLRDASKGQNAQRGQFKAGATGYRGVIKRDDLIEKPFRASLKVNQKNLNLGYFATAEDAARAYDRAALEHFGVLAHFNFPGDVGVPDNATNVFGYSYILDMYDCAPGTCDDLELHYRFLERLVDSLGMDKMSAPLVIHAPTNKGVEIYADKAGVSGWIPLIQSGVSIHSIEPTHFATLDVYSCKPFEAEQVTRVAQPTFGYAKYEDHFMDRGIRYPKVVT